jgi:hypothetical protein
MKKLEISLDRKLAEFIDSLPDGDRSRFVNDLLAREIARLKGETKHA